VADLYQQAQQFREQLLSGDRRTAGVMVRSYGNAYGAIDQEIDRIRLRIFDLRQKGVEKERFASLLYQEKRVQALQDKTLAEISKFAQRADIIVGGSVGEAVLTGSRDALTPADVLGESITTSFGVFPLLAEELPGAIGDVVHGLPSRTECGFCCGDPSAVGLLELMPPGVAAADKRVDLLHLGRDGIRSPLDLLPAGRADP
jgi:hypothetical protein